MSFIEKSKEMYDLQKKAREMKKKLQAIIIEEEVGGIKVVINGEQKIQSVEIDDDTDTSNKRTLENNIRRVMERAINKAQSEAAKNMKDQMGDLGLPGF